MKVLLIGGPRDGEELKLESLEDLEAPDYRKIFSVGEGAVLSENITSAVLAHASLTDGEAQDAWTKVREQREKVLRPDF